MQVCTQAKRHTCSDRSKQNNRIIVSEPAEQSEKCLPEATAPVPTPKTSGGTCNGPTTLFLSSNPQLASADGLLPALPLFHPSLPLFPYLCSGINLAGTAMATQRQFYRQCQGQVVAASAGLGMGAIPIPHIPTASSMVPIPSPAGVTVLPARYLP